MNDSNFINLIVNQTPPSSGIEPQIILISQNSPPLRHRTRDHGHVPTGPRQRRQMPGYLP